MDKLFSDSDRSFLFNLMQQQLVKVKKEKPISIRSQVYDRIIIEDLFYLVSLEGIVILCHFKVETSIDDLFLSIAQTLVSC